MGSLKRDDRNPLLTRRDIPALSPALLDVSSVFNPGAAKKDGKVLLMLRVQNRGRETFFLMAESEDGVRFSVAREPVRFQGLERVKEKIFHCYDARITALEGAWYILFAMDMESGCRLGLGRTEDFRTFRFLEIVSREENRNGVLFPEKIGGRYLRLDRPNRVRVAEGAPSGDRIALSSSRDLLTWDPEGEVMAGRFHYWDELIGAGPPPLKTREGWLLIYHGVALHLAGAHIYQAGVALLELENPVRLIARSRQNILEPRELYECVGQVPNVVFPSGAVAETIDSDGFVPLDSLITVYYGAADTCLCAARASAGELIRAAREGGGPLP